MDKPPPIQLPGLPAIDAFGAVDLEEMPCTGCVHASSKGACKRFPPVFMPPYPEQRGSELMMRPGGWSFPPAIRKCGEYKRPVETA